MEQSGKALTPGTRTTVRRLNGEEAQGVIMGPAIEHLRHIGEFYLIGHKMPEGRRRGRKSEASQAQEQPGNIIGMYERAYIRLQEGA